MKTPSSAEAELRRAREVYASALQAAEREFRDAQAALSASDSGSDDQLRSRYAQALLAYERLQSMFPFVASSRESARA